MAPLGKSGNAKEAGNGPSNCGRSVSLSRGSVGMGGIEGEGSSNGDALSPFLSLTPAAAPFVPHRSPSPPPLPLPTATSLGAPPGLPPGFGPPPGLFGSSEASVAPLGLTSVPLPHQADSAASLPPPPPPSPPRGSHKSQVDDLDLDLMHLAAEAGLGDMLDEDDDDEDQGVGSGRGSPDLRLSSSSDSGNHHGSTMGGSGPGSGNNNGGGSRLMGLFGSSANERSDGGSMGGFW